MCNVTKYSWESSLQLKERQGEVIIELAHRLIQETALIEKVHNTCVETDSEILQNFGKKRSMGGIKIIDSRFLFCYRSRAAPVYMFSVLLY